MTCCSHNHVHPSARPSGPLEETPVVDRRRVLAMGAAGLTAAGAASVAVAAAGVTDPAAAQTASSVSGADPYAAPAEPALPPSSMALEKGRAALLVVDPQIDFLSPEGVAWGVVGESVAEHKVVDNLTRLFQAAKAADMPVVISPHYYYPHDHQWRFEGALEKVMHSIGMFDRPGPLDLTGMDGSGADFMPQYKDYIFDGKTIIASPHKVYGPEQNDAGLQLRKLRVDQIVLAGMSANLCVESHMREFLEQGFEVAVVRDATAGAKIPEGDGYLAALINFRMMANAVWSTDEAVDRFAALSA